MMENENYKGLNPENQAATTVDESDGEAVGVKEKFVPEDPTKIKFTNAANNYVDSKNGDAKVDIENVQVFSGLSKEELMKYANDPFWVRLRMAMFVLFWILWVSMLVGAVIIILVTPRCAPPPTLDWWQKSAIYQVEVGAYQDSNNDGTGDLRGLISKLDYLKEIGIESLLLSPIFQSDAPYAATSFEAIDPKYGTLEEFTELVKEMNERDMKIILEFVPNHSSLNHPWFEESSSSETSPQANYYVWKKEVPNNWQSESGGSAWTYNDKRRAYYYHKFSEKEPDLNFADEKVKELMQEVMKFWLDRGVSGFKINYAAYLMEDSNFADESSENDGSKTKNQPKTFELLREWRDYLRNYTSTHGTDTKVLLTEVYDSPETVLKYYGTPAEPIADLALNHQLFSLPSNFNAKTLLDNVVSVTNKTDPAFWQNFVLSNPDVGHLAGRIGTNFLDGVLMFSLMTSGTPLLYYGDEVGLQDPNAASLPIRQKASIPVGTKMEWTNVEAQRNGTSHLHLFTKLTEIRGRQAIRLGSVNYNTIGENIFTLTRVRKGTPAYLLAVNFSPNATVADLTKACITVPDSGNVELVSSNSQRQTGVKLKLTEVTIAPAEGILVQYVPKLD